MSLTPTKPENRERQLPPAGTHRAVLYKIVNLGTLTTEFKGVEKKQHKIRLFWELPDEKIEYEVNGEKKSGPFSIGKKFTFSMGDQSHLYPIVVGMVGQALTEDERWSFNIESLLGSSSLITITHDTLPDGRKFANVSSTSPLVKGMEKPTQTNQSEMIDVRKLTKEEIDNLPDYLKEDMKSSSEYHVRFLAPRGEEGSRVDKIYEESGIEEIKPEDIPF